MKHEIAEQLVDEALERGIPLDRDFHTLNSDDVQSVITMAMIHKYRKPRSANGSTARYYHARLRRALEIIERREV